MSLRSKRPSKAPETKDTEQVSEKPAATFWDGFESSGSSTTGIDQRKWRDAEIITSEPEVTEAPAQERPTSRGKIEGGKRLNHAPLLSDDPRDLFSTHRAERSSHPEAVAKREAARAKKAKEQDERAWRGMAFFLKLVSMGAGHN
ncbi:hypothetical protein WJ542_11360 [Paraburkholderia sp. B3]|uniref:hypothetical protein n=1 Tax=Paraburkholderia sp. B3 TaxID=3134791 RepID=UPI003981CE83